MEAAAGHLDKVIAIWDLTLTKGVVPPGVQGAARSQSHHMALSCGNLDEAFVAEAARGLKGTPGHRPAQRCQGHYVVFPASDSSRH